MTNNKENSIEKSLQELHKEIIDYLDLISRKFLRIRSLEERLESVENQLYTILSKIRRMENILNEYISISGERRVVVDKNTQLRQEQQKEVTDINQTQPQKSLRTTRIKKGKEEGALTEKIDITSKLNGLNETEKQIIRILASNPDIRGGTALAKRLGKTREHVSRLLKKLVNEGILVRDEKVWPYKYIVPEEVRQYIIIE
ncbi:MAG: winged helix-turn-helix transcriptional regulator [Candidatus Methanomethylicia archaeon]|nr:winged helix-turn-helix transcriptional regulator [Candidatus Methanomethylicia archaeon]MCX8169134.1 winged helix-turn-helix transcriptional regulator [Candidatus Methanomethylicia archaeon]MDW7988866.1 winged helix-turn-helix transcriptional regulator [Nitrososphaerota archaeon]